MKTQYTRKNHIIYNLDTGKQAKYPSINAAKRASRELQGKGNSGKGLVRIEK